MKQQGTPGFRTHAGRIMAVFQEAISSLSNENYVEELERIWNKIGETHNRRKISRQSFEVSFSSGISMCVCVFFTIFTLHLFGLFKFATTSTCLISH